MTLPDDDAIQLASVTGIGTSGSAHMDAYKGVPITGRDINTAEYLGMNPALLAISRAVHDNAQNAPEVVRLRARYERRSAG